MALKITDKTSAEILNDNRFVVIDFYTDWCPPCKVVGPLVDTLAIENPDIVIGKVNIDENPELKTTYEIRSIPTILFFKDGVVVDMTKGAVPKSQLQGKINNLKG